jgi:hypothetical protein
MSFKTARPCQGKISIAGDTVTLSLPAGVELEEFNGGYVLTDSAARKHLSSFHAFDAIHRGCYVDKTDVQGN